MDEKQFFTVGTVKDINAEDMVGWASKPTLDRDKEVIATTAWDKGGLDNFRKNPVLMLSHDWSRPPVGKVIWVKNTPEGLTFKAQFANTPIGQELKQLYKDGMMNAFSVGFEGRKAIDPKVTPGYDEYKEANRVFTEAELFEISCVSIPSCPDALVQYVKSGKSKSDELNEFVESFTKEMEKTEIDVEVKEEKRAGISLNTTAESHASSLIGSGKVNTTAPWTFDSSDENAILGDPPDWTEYNKWFLGHRDGANKETKNYYMYAFGKGGEVYRSGLTAIRQRAGQQGDTNIFDAAGTLIEKIDKKKEAEIIETKIGRRISATNMEVIQNAINILMDLVETPAPSACEEVITEACSGGKMSVLDEIVMPEQKTVDLESVEKSDNKEFDLDSVERKEEIIAEMKRISDAKRLGKAFI